MTPDLKQAFFRVAPPVKKAVSHLKTKADVSVTVRMTAEEKADLQRDAGQRTLSNHIRNRLFGVKGKRGPDRLPSFDTKELARVLGLLGQSNIVSNLAALGEAARSGTLEDGPSLLSAVERACADIRAMRQGLLCALGVKSD